MDVSETSLFNEAFSLDGPKENAPRLRLMKDDGGRSTRIFTGALDRLRTGFTRQSETPGMHKPQESDGGEEQLALEQLAAFSLLARWIDPSKSIEYKYQAMCA